MRIARLAASLLILLTGDASARSDEIAVIRGENVRVRVNPDTDDSVAAILQRGDIVTISGDAILPNGRTELVTSTSLAAARLDVLVPIETADGATGWVMEVFLDPDSVVQIVEQGQTPEPTVTEAPEPAERENRQRNRQRRATAETTTQAPVPTEGPTSIPALTEDPAPVPTPAAEPAPTVVFESGGLGVKVEEFEDRYDRFGVGVETERGRAYQTTNGQLIAGPEGTPRIAYIGRSFDKPLSIQGARTTALRLTPADTELIETEVTVTGITVDLYTSPSLATVISDPGTYPGGEPGQFTVSYGDYNPDAGVTAVSDFEIALGHQSTGSDTETEAP